MVREVKMSAMKEKGSLSGRELFGKKIVRGKADAACNGKKNTDLCGDTYKAALDYSGNDYFVFYALVGVFDGQCPAATCYKDCQEKYDAYYDSHNDSSFKIADIQDILKKYCDPDLGVFGFSVGFISFLFSLMLGILSVFIN